MSWKRKSNGWGLTIAAGMLVAGLLAWSGRGARIANAAAKGLDIEIAYEIKALKIAGSTSPVYVQADNGKLIFSDASGAVMSSPMGGGTATTLAKVANPAGLAIAPAGFGSYTGQVFVASGSDEKTPCEIMRIGGASATSFAKLPDAGKLNGGKATQCRDLEFGAAGSPFAGKLYAVANGNATIYEIDSSGKAKAFATFDGTPSYEITSVSFTAPTDSIRDDFYNIELITTIAPLPGFPCSDGSAITIVLPTIRKQFGSTSPLAKGRVTPLSSTR